MAIYIENKAKTPFHFHYRVVLTSVVQKVMREKDIPEELDVNILIVSPEEIRGINRDTRGVDAVTDVLSFPYFEYDTPGVFDREIQEWADEDILGDIVICGEKALMQAEEYGHSPKRELAFLTVHSMLHLLGYDHMEAADAQLMEAEQKRIMEEAGILRV